MSIIISNPPVQPAVNYDHVHLCKLEIEQPVNTDNAAQPIYKVVVNYRLYGIDASNVRHYQAGECNRIGIDDYYVLAATKAAAGDMSLANAVGAIESAVAAIVTHATGSATTVA